jgi:hypothetical protein
MMARRRTRLAWMQGLAALIIAAVVASPCLAAQPTQTDSTPLIKLAASKFHSLTEAERAMLRFSDVENTHRGEWAFCGPNTAPSDPSNDPKDVRNWTHERDIRASLIRWLTAYRAASDLIDPKGIRILGARIVGPLDLSHVRVPFSISMVQCSIAEPINIDSTEIPHLDLDGSNTAGIYAPNLNVAGELDLGFDNIMRPSHIDMVASGEVYLDAAKVGGEVHFGESHFQRTRAEPWDQPQDESLRRAVVVTNSQIRGSLFLCCGFESDGGVDLSGTTVGGSLFLGGGHFHNPDRIALNATGVGISNFVYLVNVIDGGDFESDGAVEFDDAHVGGVFAVDGARFDGRPTERHGLFAEGIVVNSALIWRRVTLANGATMDVSGAKVRTLVDERKSWPQSGKLLIDDFTYDGFGPDSPWDVRSRLEWIRLDTFKISYHPQPYRQLATVYREFGLESFATQVSVAGEDERYKLYGWPGWLWGGFLKYTIAYGHRPLLALFWSLAVVLLGWLVVSVGSSAGVMCETWPESKPLEARKSYERLSPFLYSLDVFLPFVNLHQERYWWADADAIGQFAILGRRMHISGRVLRRYLWLQIIAGWLLSAIFIAGITGLIRND